MVTSKEAWAEVQAMKENDKRELTAEMNPDILWCQRVLSFHFLRDSHWEELTRSQTCFQNWRTPLVAATDEKLRQVRDF